MSESIKIAPISAVRAVALRKSIRRHRLVFMQCGSIFDVLRRDLLADTSHQICTAYDLAASGAEDLAFEPGVLLVTDLEKFATTGSHDSATLGSLRVRIDALLDEGIDVCLVSRAPRCAYRPVPGSSVLDDSALFTVALLDTDECVGSRPVDAVGENLPSFALANPQPELVDLFRCALLELGSEVLAALDHALYEVGLPQQFLAHLDVRELEALRGAGFVVRSSADDAVEFAVPQRLIEFRSALADALASLIEPPVDLADVSDGLWRIERSIRLRLRKSAQEKLGQGWRKQALHGNLAAKALERARLDAAVTAKSVAELRDPIEWLSLGELLEVVTGATFNGLGQDNVLWTKFSNEIVPIRNRLSHMRLIKKGDRETVLMWASRIERIS